MGSEPPRTKWGIQRQKYETEQEQRRTTLETEPEEHAAVIFKLTEANTTTPKSLAGNRK